MGRWLKIAVRVTATRSGDVLLGEKKAQGHMKLSSLCERLAPGIGIRLRFTAPEGRTNSISQNNDEDDN